jgi:hypothetical protein
MQMNQLLEETIGLRDEERLRRFVAMPGLDVFVGLEAD